MRTNLLSLSLRFAMAAALLTACTVEGDSTLGSSRSPILGGQPGSAGQFPTAVAIYDRAGSLCSGTLITPQWVLTAAHCVTPSLLGYSTQGQVTSNTIVILDSDDVLAGHGSQHSVVATIPEPGFSDRALGDNDIGLIKLSSPVTDRTPTPINRIKEDAPVGISVLQVGYGISEVGNQNSAGTLYYLEGKQTASCSTWGESDNNLLCYSQADGSGKCSGDSGGPSYATINGVRRVVGVTSFGDQNCQQMGADTRVDAELDFLYQNVPELQCQADGACNNICGSGALPTDPDCPTCAATSDCGDGEVCGADGQCEPAPFEPGGLGAECQNSSDCASGLCGMTAEGGTCTQGCDANDSCPDGFDCVDTSNGTSVCWPRPGGGGGSGGAGDNMTGGCAAGGGPAGSLWLLLVGLGGLFCRRRRSV